MFERVDMQLVGALLGRAANTSAPGDNRILADIVKAFWHRDKRRITQLVRAWFWLGHQPELWKGQDSEGGCNPKARKAGLL